MQALKFKKKMTEEEIAEHTIRRGKQEQERNKRREEILRQIGKKSKM